MAQDLLINIVGNAAGLKNALGNAEGQVKSFSDKLAGIGRTATIAGTAITAAFTKTFIDFTAYETKLVDMAKVTNIPFDQITASIKTIDPVLGSSKELMSGYYQVISAGVKDPVKALDTLTVAAQTGKAAHVAQAEVVKGITKMMAGYEGAISSASEAADLLFAIEKEGQTSVAELIPVIGGLAKMSSDLGIAQEAMGASMAVISKTAGTTAEAATQYKAALVGLMKPTGDMILAIKDQGYASAELAIKDKGLVDVLKDLEAYSEKTGISMTKLFGSQEALIGVSALGAEGFKTLDDTIISVGGSVGGLDKAFLNWSESGAAAIDGIKNTFANFVVMIGEKVAPKIKDVLETVTDVIAKVTEWADENEDLVEGIFNWAAGLGAALMVLGPIAVILPSLITGVTLLSHAFLPFVISGLIVAGLIKIQDLLGGIKERAFEAATGFKEMPLDELDAKIVEMEKTIADWKDELEAADKGFNIFGITIKNQQVNIDRLKQSIKDEKKYLGLLKEQRDKLTGAEKDGIDVAEKKLDIDKKIAEGQETINKLLDDWKDKVQLLTKYTGEANDTNIELLDGMYRWTQVASQWERVSLYFMGVRDSLKPVKTATDEVTVSQEAMAKATGKVYNQWYELAKLWEVRPDLRAYFDGVRAAVEETPDISPWGEFFDSLKERYSDTAGVIQSGISNVISSAENALGDAFYNIISGTKTLGESMKELWKSIVDSILMELARLAAFYVFKWIFGVPTFDIGGGIGFDKGGQVKGYAPGGGVDTIPAKLTIGEYVISKPMTDFIRQFKSFPASLIGAISNGMPTPTPAFNSGGLVGGSNAISGYGNTEINVYISGNTISKDIDIRRLADTVGDKVLQNINRTRRH